MNNPEISVVMGVYNGEGRIKNAILSILSQSFTDFELIIINDGSTDNTQQIIDEFDDSRIISLSQENLGLTKTLNKGIKLAKGKYIARQDSDDISIYNRFELQLQAFEQDPELDMIGTSMFITNQKGIYNEVFLYPDSYEDCQSSISRFNPFVHGSVMIKKDVLLNENLYNEDFRYVQDYELWSRLIPRYKCKNILEPLYARTRDKVCSEQSVDKTEYVEKIQSQIQQMTSDKNIEITPISIYPLINYPSKYTKTLSETFKRMYQQGIENEKDIKLKFTSIFYCPQNI